MFSKIQFKVMQRAGIDGLPSGKAELADLRDCPHNRDLGIGAGIEGLSGSTLQLRWKTALLALGAASLEVQRRPLTSAEALTVVSQIACSPEITGYSTAEWTGGKDTFVLIDPGTNSILGAVLVHHLAFNWSEVAVVFVLEGYRALGLGSYMLASVLRTIEHGGRSILLFFRKGNMRQLASKRGFEIYDDQREYCSKSIFNLIHVRFVYQLQWLSNAYRRKELRRKRIEFGVEFTFHLAIRRARPAAFKNTHLQRADTAQQATE